jgi:hypothetical protein
VKRLREGPALALAGVAAPLAATFYWMAVDDIAARQAFSSPFPYLLFGLTWFVGLPIFAFTRPWHQDRLWRLLLLATIGASPFAAKAIHYFLTPRDLFVTFLIMTTAWAATLTLWGVLRLVRP